MIPSMVDEFRDPETGTRLCLGDYTEEGGRVKNGELSVKDADQVWPITDFIPRFVASDEYTGSFGYQWNVHQKTQLDSFNGATYSRDRLYATAGWDANVDFTGQRVLEAGAGAGRFTEILLQTGADVFSFDLSAAIEANARNNARNGATIFQASIYRIPMAKHSFDKVVCLGVLQHTPDVHMSFRALAEMVRPGGQLIVDLYPSTWKHNLHWKYVLRPITTRMAPERLHRFVTWYAPKLMPLAKLARRLGGSAAVRLIPILDQSDKAVSPEIQREWTILDTFDALSARYDQPQTRATLQRWFEEQRFRDVYVSTENGLIGRGVAS